MDASVGLALAVVAGVTLVCFVAVVLCVQRYYTRATRSSPRWLARADAAVASTVHPSIPVHDLLHSHRLPLSSFPHSVPDPTPAQVSDSRVSGSCAPRLEQDVKRPRKVKKRRRRKVGGDVGGGGGDGGGDVGGVGGAGDGGGDGVGGDGVGGGGGGDVGSDGVGGVGVDVGGGGVGGDGVGSAGDGADDGGGVGVDVGVDVGADGAGNADDGSAGDGDAAEPNTEPNGGGSAQMDMESKEADAGTEASSLAASTALTTPDPTPASLAQPPSGASAVDGRIKVDPNPPGIPFRGYTEGHEIDEALYAAMSRLAFPVDVLKTPTGGVYLINGSRFHVRVINAKPLVRVGAAWVPFASHAAAYHARHHNAASYSRAHDPRPPPSVPLDAWHASSSHLSSASSSASASASSADAHAHAEAF